MGCGHGARGVRTAGQGDADMGVEVRTGSQWDADRESVGCGQGAKEVQTGIQEGADKKPARVARGVIETPPDPWFMQLSDSEHQGICHNIATIIA